MRSLIMCGLGAAVAVACPLAAQGPAGAADAGGGLTVSASVRSRVESWDWFGQESEGEYVFVGNLIRAGLAQQRQSLGWQVELAAPVLLGLPDDAVLPPPRGQAGLGPAYYAANDGKESVAGVFLKQAYLRLGAQPGRPGHGVRAGRFEFVEGAEVVPRDPTLAAVKSSRVAQRLLGTFGFTHVGRSLDGLHYAYGGPGLNVTAAAGRPTRGVFDANGWPELDVGVAYVALTLPQPDEESPGEGRLFALYYRDYRDDAVKTDNRPLAVRQAGAGQIGITTLGGHYLRALRGGAGTADVMLWGAYQLGSWGEQDHRAWAATAEVGLQPPVLAALRPWLRVGYFQSTGDDSAGDDRHGTFFQVLPTPRVYARFPFYNQMNLREAFGSLIVRPSPRLSLRGDARLLRLTQASDLWYAGGGAFEEESFGFAGRPSGGERALATLLDVSADLRLTPRLTASGFLGWARGGEVVESLHPQGARGRFGFVEVEWRM